MDSRDLEKEIEELEQAKEAKEEYNEERLKALLELKAECEGYGWEYGIYFILADDWEDYCQKLAEDCGYIKDTYNPLYNCIDWEKWADLVSYDYSMAVFEGETYYFREA